MDKYKKIVDDILEALAWDGIRDINERALVEWIRDTLVRKSDYIKDLEDDIKITINSNEKLEEEVGNHERFEYAFMKHYIPKYINGEITKRKMLRGLIDCYNESGLESELYNKTYVLNYLNNK